MSISTYNKSAKRFTFTASPDFKYYKLKDLKKDQIYPLLGWFINEKGKYGPSAALITDKFYVNVPQHIMDRLRDMEKDAELIEEINAGKAGFKAVTYTTNTGATGYSVEWVDVEPLPF